MNVMDIPALSGATRTGHLRDLRDDRFGLFRRLNTECGDLGRATILGIPDRKSTRLNSSHSSISYAVFCLKKKKRTKTTTTKLYNIKCLIYTIPTLCLSVSSARQIELLARNGDASLLLSSGP